jgi:hypothetical protein
VIDVPGGSTSSRWRGWLGAVAPYAGLIALNVLFRLPLLLNADNVHSDAAIVGLQAMHLLNGETARFVWGVTHQGAFDVWVVAAFFLLGGPTPLMLMLAPFVGHLVLSCVLFALLRRLLPGRAAAFITCLTLVFTTQAINGIVAYVPRQWSITVALCGAVLIAWPTRRTPLRLALGTALALSSIYLDFFCTLWMPGIGLLVLLVCLEPPREPKAVALRLAGAAAGTLSGVVLVTALRGGWTQPAASDFGLSFIERNWPLMRDTSLPWLLGAKVWIPGATRHPELWHPPAWVAAFQWFGAASVVVLVLASAALVFSPRVRWEVKRLVLFGLAASVTTLGGFLLGTFPSDLWTTRYLGPVIWSLPFSLAALASAVRPRRLLALLAPYLVVAAFAGWLSYGSGAPSNFDSRRARQAEVELGEFLRQRGYTHGYAPYWLAYRLTFLWTENPLIAPLDSDRYPPYSQATERARKQAFIFDPNEHSALVDRNLAYVRRQRGRVEVVSVAGFTVILYEQ